MEFENIYKNLTIALYIIIPDMDLKQKLYSGVFSDKNINALMQIIQQDKELIAMIKLNNIDKESFFLKCKTKIKNYLKKYFDEVSDVSQIRDIKQCQQMLTTINQNTLSDIHKTIQNSFNRKRKNTNQNMQRDQEVYGPRDNHFMKRPDVDKNTFEDSNVIDMSNDRSGFEGIGPSSRGDMYASPWENHSITNIPAAGQGPGGQGSISQFNIPSNSPYAGNFNQEPKQLSSDPRSMDMDSRLQRMKSDRDQDFGRQHQKPPEINFSLDPNGDRMRKERLKQSQPNSDINGMSSMSSMGGMNSMGMNGMDPAMGMFDNYDPMAGNIESLDPVAGLLGPGMPGNLNMQQMQGMPNQQMQMGMPNQQMQGMQDRGGYSMESNNSQKSMDLSTNLERMIAERQRIDADTGHKMVKSNTQSSVMQNQMPMMPMMGMPNQQMQMSMHNQQMMGMPNQQMMGMPSQQMQMSMPNQQMMGMPNQQMQMGMPNQQMMGMPNQQMQMGMPNQQMQMSIPNQQMQMGMPGQQIPMGTPIMGTTIQHQQMPQYQYNQPGMPNGNYGNNLNNQNIIMSMPGINYDNAMTIVSLDASQVESLLNSYQQGGPSQAISQSPIKRVEEIEVELRALSNSSSDESEKRKELIQELLSIRNKMAQVVDTQVIDTPIESPELSSDPIKEVVTIKYVDGDPNMEQINAPRFIKQILLVKYRIFRSKNNITRYNNKFRFMMGEKLFNFTFQPGEYSIDSIIFILKTHFNFLDVSITDRNKIVISNNMKMNFNLLPMNDDIFKLLGFMKVQDEYKNRKFYTGEEVHGLNSDDLGKLIFINARPSLDPLEVDFGAEKDTTLNMKLSLDDQKELTLMIRDTWDQLVELDPKSYVEFTIVY
jgi:hypothetical protein